MMRTLRYKGSFDEDGKNISDLVGGRELLNVTE
jgi:hypothetical protein